MARKSSRQPALPERLGIARSRLSASAEEGIVASGTGEVRVPPDSLRIRVGVEARGKSVAEVQSAANVTMTRVLESLHALQIPGIQMRTSFLDVSPVYERTETGINTEKIVGYSASNTVSVAVRKVPADKIAGHASAILNAAVNTGANVSGGFDLFLDDPASAQEKALAKAVQDARHRGEIMAKAAGVAITGVSLVSEASSFTPSFTAYQAPIRGGAVAESATTPVEAGEISVTSSVTMRLMTR
jgi:hypothetical protein